MSAEKKTWKESDARVIDGWGRFSRAGQDVIACGLVRRRLHDSAVGTVEPMRCLRSRLAQVSAGTLCGAESASLPEKWIWPWPQCCLLYNMLASDWAYWRLVQSGRSKYILPEFSTRSWASWDPPRLCLDGEAMPRGACEGAGK